MSHPSRVLVTGAAALLGVVVVGCGGSDQPTGIEGGKDKTQVCGEATQAYGDFQKGLSPTDLDAFNQKATELSGKLDGLAKQSGDEQLRSVLRDMSKTWAQTKLDPANLGAMQQTLGQLTEQSNRLREICA